MKIRVTFLYKVPIFVIFLAFAVFADGAQTGCETQLVDREEYSDFFSPMSYLVYDHLKPTQFFVQGIVLNETLNFSINLKNLGGERSLLLRGKDQFNKMLSHFKKSGTKVKAIESVMLGQQEGEYNPLYYNTNLELLNFFYSKGESLEEAAKNTWTGRQAIRHGYTEVEVQEVIFNKEKTKITEAIVQYSTP